MPIANLQIKPQRSNDIVFQNMPPEMILLNLDTGYYYSTNTLGAKVWHQCDGETKILQITQNLHKQFDVSLEQLTEDILSFVNQMITEGLLKAVSHA